MNIKKLKIILFIITLVGIHVCIWFNNILLINSKDKLKIIELYNLPTNSEIVFVKGLHTSLERHWPILVSYKYENEIIEKTLIDDSEGSETQKLAINLHEKTIKSLLILFDIIIFIFSIIIVYKKSKIKTNI